MAKDSVVGSHIGDSCQILAEATWTRKKVKKEKYIHDNNISTYLEVEACNKSSKFPKPLMPMLKAYICINFHYNKFVLEYCFHRKKIAPKIEPYIKIGNETT